MQIKRASHPHTEMCGWLARFYLNSLNTYLTN